MVVVNRIKTLTQRDVNKKFKDTDNRQSSDSTHWINSIHLSYNTLMCFPRVQNFWACKNAKIAWGLT